MPLTPAHPAAILPFGRALRGWSVPSALVIGSMGPDFVYYLPVSLDRPVSHTFGALIWFVLPVGLVFYGAYHLVLRRPLEDLLPAGVRARLESLPRNATPWSLRRLPCVALCLVLGGATHLLWDSFTHGGGWFVEHVAFLQARVGEVGQYEIWGYKYLQHGSTLAGLGCLAWWARRWYRRTPAEGASHEEPARSGWRTLVVAVVGGAGLAAGLTAGLAAPDKEGWLEHLQYFAGPFVIASTCTGMGVFVAYSVLWHLLRRRRVPQRAR